jgi:2,4-dichlorophenol 6-monooxygenase
MEVFRDLGIEAQVLAVSTPLKSLAHGVMATSLTGLEIARYGCYGGAAHQLSDFALASPCQMVNLPQHILEPLLLARARETGADVRFSTELVAIEHEKASNGGGVVARVRQRHTGVEYRVRAQYAVGADGARSTVAAQLGFEFNGQPNLMSMTSTWFDADLTAYTAHRPAGLYQIVQPGNAFWVGSGLLIQVTPFTEWVMNRQYNASSDGGDEPDLSRESHAKYIRETLGVPGLEVHVKSVSKWAVNNVAATQYRAGRVFLAGDAAHRHPPTSGLGSNTCVQDAFNLAWKLALVVKGQAADALLDSYNEERQPIGQQIVSHAIQTLHNMALVPQALGFHHGQTKEDGFQKLDELFFSDTPGAEERRKKLEEVVQLQDRRSNAIGLQLGQRYTSRAVVDDGTPFPPYQRDPVLYYEPTTHPGGYLPHAWVEHKGKRVSTLDIVGQRRFVLIVGIGGRVWIAAASTASDEVGVEVLVRQIGYRCPYDDVLREWTSRREVGDHGAILVRPDRHIAWRCASLPADPVAELSSALRRVLSR